MQLGSEWKRMITLLLCHDNCKMVIKATHKTSGCAICLMMCEWRKMTTYMYMLQHISTKYDILSLCCGPLQQ